MTPAPRIGTEFAGYRIEGLLGRGGMGVVYRAEHPRLGATVALKVMDPELAMNETFRERFVREARAAAQIKHPNIVPIYDAGEWHGDLYIAMRYIEGEELRSVLRREGALRTDRTSVIGQQIASALDAAHRNGLIHRDVKPANILIEPGPDPDSAPIAYLADLGLTKHVDSHSGVTGSGELLGTIDYIAPEQIEGSRVDGRADIYSLACVLFECLTGSVPYVRENQAAVLWAHLHDEAPTASSVNPTVTRGVDATLARGMAKSPEDRFQTARELVAALESPPDSTTTVSRNGGATRSMPGAPSTSTGRWSRAARRRSGRLAIVLAALVGVLLGGAVAAGIVSVLMDDDPATPTTPAQPAAPPGEPSASETTTAGETTRSPTVGLSQYQKDLLQHVPLEFRRTCRPVGKLTADFDATLSCHAGGPVSSLTYSHARSGPVLYDYFASRMPRAGLPASTPLPLIGLCSTGVSPSVRHTLPAGLSGRVEALEQVNRQERLGTVFCYKHAGRAQIEWITNEIGVYAAATGDELEPLYEWWSRDAGPEP